MSDDSLDVSECDTYKGEGEGGKGKKRRGRKREGGKGGMCYTKEIEHVLKTTRTVRTQKKARTHASIHTNRTTMSFHNLVSCLAFLSPFSLALSLSLSFFLSCSVLSFSPKNKKKTPNGSGPANIWDFFGGVLFCLLHVPCIKPC